MYSHFWIKGYKPYTFTPTPPPHSSSEPHWKCYRNEENLEETHPEVKFSYFYSQLKTTKRSTNRMPLNPKKFAGIVQEMRPCHILKFSQNLHFFRISYSNFHKWRWSLALRNRSVNDFFTDLHGLTPIQPIWIIQIPAFAEHYGYLTNSNSKNESSTNSYSCQTNSSPASWENDRITSRPAVKWYEKRQEFRKFLQF